MWTAFSLGRTDPEAFQLRANTAELARRIDVRVAPDLEDQWPESSPARLSVETGDGTRVKVVTNPRGFYSEIIRSSEVREKFRCLAGRGLSSIDGELWWGRLTRLTGVADCASLFARQSP